VWTIGIARTGNLVGLSAEDFAALPSAEKAPRIEHARAQLTGAGAHHVIDTVADCEPTLDAIETRLRSGERP
jgi:phosphonoacetaldehyde hydrolase